MVDGLIIPGVVTIADIILDNKFTGEYLSGKYSHLASQAEPEKRRAWKNLFDANVINPKPTILSLAQEHGFEEFLATEYHVAEHCKMIARALGKGTSINSSQVYDLVRGLAHTQHILYHRHCENSRLGIDMSFDEAALDYTGRGFNVGLRKRMNEKSVSIETILCARTLEMCCKEVDAYEATPESLDVDVPLVEGTFKIFPTGYYTLNQGRYVPCGSMPMIDARTLKCA